jgi:fructose/tagatose bisphosphate aldolase
MVALITSVVRSRDVIASLHLDHSPTFDKVVECIRDGYTPVMCDGSTLPLEQNLQLTRDVVRAGVSVEAEVGTIGTTAEYGADIENPHLADPAACEAMEETGIDALAVAISNAHSVSIAEHKLDFDLLAEIRRHAEVPRVLHGGSAIPVDQVQKAIGGRGQDERRNRNPRSVSRDTATAPPARFALHMSSATGAIAAKSVARWTRVFSVVPHDLGDRPRVILR